MVTAVTEIQVLTKKLQEFIIVGHLVHSNKQGNLKIGRTYVLNKLQMVNW